MCFSLPSQVNKVLPDKKVEIDIQGEKRVVKTDVVSDLKQGDWILTHANMATQKISEDEAKEISELFEKLS